MVLFSSKVSHQEVFSVDFPQIIPVLFIAVCIFCITFMRQMPNEPPTVTDHLVVTVTSNLTEQPRRQKSIIMPLTSMIPVLIPDGEITEVEVKVENVLLCAEFPMLPIVIKDYWIAPGTRIPVAVHKTLDGDILRIERI